jgi:predicted O-methyltransferase YrrM
VSDRDLNWKYVDESVVESDAIAKARQQALEHGIDPVSPADGAPLGVIAAAARAESSIEVGTGVGVSGLWMLQTVRSAMLTSIDTENEYQQHAREHFADAGIAPARVRLIAGRASEVLPRMNDGAYDLVLVDADAASVLDYVQHGLRIARRGGLVLVARALWKGRVADPAQRDDTVADFRALLSTIQESGAVQASLIPSGDGLLQLVKLTD